MFTIEKLAGLEILDSRGRPTVQAACRLAGGCEGSASVPSGASTGTAEARELRDGDPARYGGAGCRRAVAQVNDSIRLALAGRAFESQEQLDAALIHLDGTPEKGRLGANAILAVSLAFARAAATQQRLPLYRYFAELAGEPVKWLPRPTINLFSGGKHAGGQAPLQDVLMIPVSARTVDECLAMSHAVYQAAVELILKKYDMRLLRADEGGLAPPFDACETMFEDALEAIQAAGFKPGEDMVLGLDVAASHFFKKGRYHLGKESLDSPGMIGRLKAWASRYPVASIEDGLAEEDWAHWPALRQGLEGRALVVGDDLLCTNPARIRRAIEAGAADTLLLKVNQIGTVSEALASNRLARGAQWQVTISARSGETEDHWLADLAAGWNGNQIKVGSITQSERLSKYNRLLAIEAETGLPLNEWPNR